MRCLTGTVFVLVVISKTLLGAVLHGNNLLGHDELMEPNYMTNGFRNADEYDHRIDYTYSSIIFNNEDDTELFKELQPNNILGRIKIILDIIDQDKNGHIDKKELSDQLMKNYRKLSAEEADAEFLTIDRDNNDFVTWNEYIGDIYSVGEIKNNLKEDKTLFLAADTDNDGMLDELEFQYFYIPEDYPHMKPAILRGVMDRLDTDKDGSITFDEFIGDRKKDHSDNWIEDENYKFHHILDVNNNGILDEDEIYKWASPSHRMIAESEAENCIFKADKNRDGILSFSEILENYSLFITVEREESYIIKEEL